MKNDPLNGVDPSGTEVGPAFDAVNGNCTGTRVGAGCGFVQGALENMAAMNRDSSKDTTAGGTKAAEATTVENRRGGNRGNQGQGERGKAGKASGTPNPGKHVRPARGKPGQWEQKDPHTGDWKLKPKGWVPIEQAEETDRVAIDNASSAESRPEIGIGIGIGVLAVGCALLEPCGAAAAAALGIAGTATLATQ